MAKQLIRACLLLLVGALAIQAQGEIKDGSYQGEAAIDGDKYSVTLSVKTVSAHTEHVYAKLGVTSRGAAALYAMRHGLMTPAETVTPHP